MTRFEDSRRHFRSPMRSRLYSRPSALPLARTRAMIDMIHARRTCEKYMASFTLALGNDSLEDHTPDTTTSSTAADVTTPHTMAANT